MLHLVMPSVIVLLIVGPFFSAGYALSVDPTDESWVPGMPFLWLLALLLIPVWIAWAVVRGAR